MKTKSVEPHFMSKATYGNITVCVRHVFILFNTFEFVHTYGEVYGTVPPVLNFSIIIILLLGLIFS